MLGSIQPTVNGTEMDSDCASAGAGIAPSRSSASLTRGSRIGALPRRSLRETAYPNTNRPRNALATSSHTGSASDAQSRWGRGGAGTGAVWIGVGPDTSNGAGASAICGAAGRMRNGIEGKATLNTGSNSIAHTIAVQTACRTAAARARASHIAASAANARTSERTEASARAFNASE